MRHGPQDQQVPDRSRGGCGEHSPSRVGLIAAALIAVVAFFGAVAANAQIAATKKAEITDGLNDGTTYSFPQASYSNNVLYIDLHRQFLRLWCALRWHDRRP